jgi:hypothetical protein
MLRICMQHWKINHCAALVAVAFMCALGAAQHSVVQSQKP